MNDLVEHLTKAVEAGAIPAPISGEAMDSYRLRAAHAGAIIGAQWYAARSEELQREAVAAAEQAAAARALQVVDDDVDEDAPQVEELDLGSVRG